MEERHFDPEQVKVKIGIDDGQVLLKVCAQLLCANQTKVSLSFPLVYTKYMNLGKSIRGQCPQAINIGCRSNGSRALFKYQNVDERAQFRPS